MSTHLPIRWGHPVWVRFVRMRDEMLQGTRPAMRCIDPHRVDPFESYNCTVCGKSGLAGYRFQHYSCKHRHARYQERQEWLHGGPREVWHLYLLPGQQFHARVCPPPSRLPLQYPITI
jgi:hypothetical protein